MILGVNPKEPQVVQLISAFLGGFQFQEQQGMPSVQELGSDEYRQAIARADPEVAQFLERKTTEGLEQLQYTYAIAVGVAVAIEVALHRQK